MKNSSLLPGIAAAITGGFLYLLFLFVLKLPLPVAIGAGIVGFTAGFFIFKPGHITAKKPKHKPVDWEAEFRKLNENARKKITRLKELQSQLTDDKAINKLDEILTVIEKLIRNFKKNPTDIEHGDKLFFYYMEATITLLEKRLNLTHHKFITPEIEESLNKSVEMLDAVKKAFKKQLESLLKDDVIDLNVEIKVLSQTLELDGLGVTYESESNRD